MHSDSVDATVDGWAKAWPRLKTSPLEIMSRLERVSRHLDRRTADALAESGLSGRDLEVLSALRRSASAVGLPTSRLARAAMLTSGGMTSEADRLVDAGLVARQPDPDDRRAVLVTLTPEGRSVVEKAVKTYLGASEEVLAVLDDDERRMLAELLRKLLVSLEGGTETSEAPDAAGPAGARRAAAGPQPGGRTRSRGKSRF